MVPEEKIQEFVRRMREAAGDNLESIVLYGSAAGESYHPDFSNLNFLCLLRDTSYRAISGVAPVARWWSGQKQTAPLLMSRAELAASSDVFTIELLDMQQHHRVLFGENFISGLKIPLRLHRIQLEYELREKLILLRQRALLATGNEKQLWELMLQSVPSFATLFRHALIALGQPAPAAKREAVRELSRFVVFDPAAIEQVLDVRERKVEPKTIDVATLFGSYLAAVEQVTNAVDKALDADQPLR